MKTHSLVDPPERGSFPGFYLYMMKKNSTYVGLCRYFVHEAYREELYEFCAMNGHLAAFEEVFKEEVA